MKRCIKILQREAKPTIPSSLYLLFLPIMLKAFNSYLQTKAFLNNNGEFPTIINLLIKLKVFIMKSSAQQSFCYNILILTCFHSAFAEAGQQLINFYFVFVAMKDNLQVVGHLHNACSVWFIMLQTIACAKAGLYYKIVGLAFLYKLFETCFQLCVLVLCRYMYISHQFQVSVYLV